DIPGVLSVDQLQEQLGLEGYPYHEASAIKGEGVMETFKLVSKITAKHLFNRLKGKPEPIERKKPEKAAKHGHGHAKPKTIAGSKKVPIPLSKPDPIPEVNPFGDSMPFPDANPLNAGYEKMEEVSLEQLLEGRERPATLSGSIPIPPIHEDVEVLGAEEMVPLDDNPLSLALMDEPAPAPAPVSAASSSQIASLEQRVRRLEGTLNDVLRTLTDLTSRIKNQIT